ncbi:MAG: tetratricopeptide repeat protein [Campylobacterota bacterium]|nr:tetratricopeptide repeat protein [Campylobacterota bacterium]
MTLFQILMLGASAFFAFKIYEHIQTLQDPKENNENSENEESDIQTPRSVEAFSTFDSASLIEKADEEVQKGDLQKALAIYSEANIKEPNNGETLFKMGYVLALQKRNEEALDSFKEALSVDGENPFTHLEMALIYMEESEFASARTHLNAALEIEPNLEKAKEALDKLNVGK